MIEVFESTVRRSPLKTCFTYVDASGAIERFSYQETRLYAAAFAQVLKQQGISRGDCVVLDLPNCPAFIFLMLAAAYGGFTLLVLNSRLTSAEKTSRVLSVEQKHQMRVATQIDSAAARRLFEQASALLTGEAPRPARESARESASQPLPMTKVARLRSSSAARPASAPGARTAPGASGSARGFANSTRPNDLERQAFGSASPRTDRALGRAGTGRASLKRRDEMMRQDAVDSIIHFAEHASRLFDRNKPALIMFTSGTTGYSKAVPLTWENICASAEISNEMLNSFGHGMWQAALPLYHIGGFQVIVRSLLNANPFMLYERFDATRILTDARTEGATHISVVDRMLQEMIHADRASGDALRDYTCILIGGGPLNAQTMERARVRGARIYASYGMTETSSQIANAPALPAFGGGLRLLPEYEAHIVDPGQDGFGRLAVKGPGVFAGYLNARAAFTVDGFFLTGDTAALRDGLLFVKERTKDMFVSGGENIYPAEICQKLMSVEGVSDAHVFGVPDAKWGRRPVAFVERDAHAGPGSLKHRIRTTLTSQLSRLYMPKHIYALDEFPRTGIGKIDRAALEAMYEDRIEIRKVTLYRIRQKFKKPFKTAKGVLEYRESILVEVTDRAGRTGLGECVAFDTDWYLPETLDEDMRVLTQTLAPLVLHEGMLHPSEASRLFDAYPEAQDHPMACGALEPALWDLYGKIVKKPLWQLLNAYMEAAETDPFVVDANGQRTAPDVTAPLSLSQIACALGRPMPSTVRVLAGAVVGLGTVEETLASVEACVRAGYKRVKLKVAPGMARPQVAAVRAAYPHLMITVDANQSFTERTVDELRALDKYNVAWIEEPLDPKRTVGTGPIDLFARLSRLQRTMNTPICLDESIAHPRDLLTALTYPNLANYAIKIGKFGGVQPTLEFIRMAKARGISVWMGGMYDTGVSKRFHAAFETLPAASLPGDIGKPTRYFAKDITLPPYQVKAGLVTLNAEDESFGAGCELNHQVLREVWVDCTVIE